MNLATNIPSSARAQPSAASRPYLCRPRLAVSQKWQSNGVTQTLIMTFLNPTPKTRLTLIGILPPDLLLSSLDCVVEYLAFGGNYISSPLPSPHRGGGGGGA
jgi:hypothetical protein